MRIHQTSEVESYILSLSQDKRDKLVESIRLLGLQNGKLSSGFTAPLGEKIWELKIEYNKQQHRITYTIISGELLVLLVPFSKKTRKTPPAIINRSIQLRKLFLKYLDE